MKYFIITMILLAMVGCGGDSSPQNAPSSPQVGDSSKTPPSVPNI